MWTGTDTTSRGLAAADLSDVTARLARPVVIWDNEHANDGGDLFFGKIWLAPYSNRAADLPGAVRGIVANPMIQGALDRLVLPTYGAFLTEPADPYLARRRAVEMESAAGSLSDTLPRLMDLFLGNAGAVGRHGRRIGPRGGGDPQRGRWAAGRAGRRWAGRSGLRHRLDYRRRRFA